MTELKLHKAYDRCKVRRPRLTVVMIHGISADASTFTRMLNYLGGRDELDYVRFVTFDLLGSGKSRADDTLEYDYDEQLTALHNSIAALRAKSPLVLVGHSMGTLIVTRYASYYPDEVQRLILLSPPVYTEADLDNPAMKKALEIFTQIVSAKHPKVAESRPFQHSMQNIVLARDNYRTLQSVHVPTTMIYGDADEFIAAHNIPVVVQGNPDYIEAIQTAGRHSVSEDKYCKVPEILLGILGAHKPSGRRNEIV